MKKNDLFMRKEMHIGRWVKTFCLCLFLVGVTSCKKGVEDELFSAGVTGVTLESPTLDGSSFATLANSDGTESVKLTWDVVYGAGGYLLNVDIVDDPTNPVEVVNDSIVDGCSIIFDKLEDTKYEISIKSLANAKLNNKEAASATVYPYSTLIPALTVPEGDDIAEFIRANLTDSDQEQGFELLGGKTYQLNSAVDFGLNTITFRGDKANRPIVVLGASGGIVTQGGLKLKFINFDCTAATTLGILSLSDNPSETISTGTLGYKTDGANQDGFVINDPVIIQECDFKNVKNGILYGNKKNWSLRDFRITDCIIQFNNSGSNSVLNLYGGSNGLIKDLTIKNNTLYNIVKNSSAYFIRYSNASNAQPQKIFGNSGNSVTFTIEYNTFSRVFSNKDFANNMANTNTITTKVQYNILFDVFRLYQFIQTNTLMYTSGNTIFGDWGGTPNSNDTGGRKDKNGNPYATLENPDFVGPFELELDLTAVNGGVNFTPRGTVAVQNKSGDPRWYENQ